MQRELTGEPGRPTSCESADCTHDHHDAGRKGPFPHPKSPSGFQLVGHLVVKKAGKYQLLLQLHINVCMRNVATLPLHLRHATCFICSKGLLNQARLGPA